MNTVKGQNSTATKGALRGVVVSNKMKDTVVVKIVRFVKDPRYGKYRKVAARVLAHDAGNTKTVGDAVLIRSCRPLSKRKHFRIV
ncbi:MAG: small subunit ribosomal protein S17 [Parcubacteria group bacterium Gr01-1014_72]|jgi:small subunit ribosomal protein S17|nr:MAG: small subunit ribosomal protein S17 [Parcubacteria group bacterium Gr01-1014_72]